MQISPSLVSIFIHLARAVLYAFLLSIYHPSPKPEAAAKQFGHSQKEAGLVARSCLYDHRDRDKKHVNIHEASARLMLWMDQTSQNYTQN